MRTFLLSALLMALAACSTTIEAQQNRFKKNTDTLEAVATKQPKMAKAIKEKIASFAKERDAIVKAGGEDAKTKLARLNSRVEAYAAKIDPSLAKKAASASNKSAASKAPAKKPASAASKAPATASKLAQPASKPAPASKAPATTGKLGAPASKAPATTGKLGAPASKAPATTGKLGAPASKAPTTGKLGAPPASQPAGKLGK